MLGRQPGTACDPERPDRSILRVLQDGNDSCISSASGYLYVSERTIILAPATRDVHDLYGDIPFIVRPKTLEEPVSV